MDMDVHAGTRLLACCCVFWQNVSCWKAVDLSQNVFFRKATISKGQRHFIFIIVHMKEVFYRLHFFLL